MGISDEEIKQQVLAKLKECKIPVDEIIVNVNQRKVQLIGTVPDYNSRRTAYNQAFFVPGVASVQNDLIIKQSTLSPPV